MGQTLLPSDRILVVGCGGIGCELLKLLRLKRFMRIAVVDFDKIALTNLNRQFFYDKGDIGKSKAAVASSLYMNSTCYSDIQFFDSDVCDMGREFFSKFSVVFGCVDDNKVRSYMSMLCVFCGIPFIDGGSAGSLGQSVYYCSGAECFDCVQKSTATSVPVCTIRTFPTNFNHCVIWAKDYFFETYVARKTSCPTSEHFSVEGVLSSEGLEIRDGRQRDMAERLAGLLSAMASRERAPVFDKDDRDVIDIIYAAASLWAVLHGIEAPSRFRAEEIISNIIPSVCTVNSIVASLMLKTAATKMNYFITNGEKIIIETSAVQRSRSCKVCRAQKYILRYGPKDVLGDILKSVEKVVGKCSAMYTDDSLLYDSDFRAALAEPFSVKRNTVLYCKGKSSSIFYCDPSEKAITISVCPIIDAYPQDDTPQS